MDNAIAMVIMGQTLTADIGSSGSKAAAETHKDLLSDYATADEVLICTFMENLAWIYGRVNAPGILTPTFRFREPEDYEAQADLDKKLADTGVKFTKAHYVRRYNLAEDEFEVALGDVAIADHAQATGYPPEQQALEDLADNERDKAAKVFDRKVMARIKSIVQESGSYDEVQERLAAELKKGFAGADLEDMLQQALVAADLWGRFQVNEEVKGDG
jgi:phage gp29-like protein